MLFGHLAQAILPAEVSRAVVTRARTAFSVDYQDTLLLLVRSPIGSDVLSGLESSAPRTPEQAFLPLRHLDYETGTNDADTIRTLMQAAARAGQIHARTVASALSQGEHFVVPLRKRVGADQISASRVSVGRAANKDIVLRDPSVSKFHAWFELHEDLDFSLTDAGSRNQTHVNGEALLPRKPSPLVAGDLIRFGSVTATLCTAEALWSAIHESAD